MLCRLGDEEPEMEEEEEEEEEEDKGDDAGMDPESEIIDEAGGTTAHVF